MSGGTPFPAGGPAGNASPAEKAAPPKGPAPIAEGTAIGARPPLTGFLVLVMAVTAGMAVANLYYIQPLLAEIAASLQVSPVGVGYAATLTQIGYAAGMLVILPLADIREKRSLIVVMLCLSAGSLLFMSFSWSASVLALAAFLVGFTSIVPQLVVPLSAQLASPGERGRIIGAVMTGLLIGILVSRTFSGLVGEHFGWRAVYWAAAVLMVLLAVLLRRWLPLAPSCPRMGYAALMMSLGPLVREHAALREAALNGAMAFGAFSVFWTTLAFLLESPRYGLGADVAGLFGLVGVVGAGAAMAAGRSADRKGSARTIWMGVAAILASYLCFLAFGFELWGLVLGVVLLDLGVQACAVSNLARVHALGDEARNRLNTVYMVSYFAGGALGSLLASYGYALFGWPGVCAAGLSFGLVAVLGRLRGRGRGRCDPSSS